MSLERGPLVVRHAPAKVNLALAVERGVDAHGYHKVRTVMAALALADEVRVREADAFSFSCEWSTATAPKTRSSIPREANLARRAALALANARGHAPNVAIELEKRIPAEAGLGGGSSDAATTLSALCALWGEDAHGSRVREVAQSLGADVPFFLGPHVALLEGRGDEFVRALPCPELAVVLVRPAGPGVPTPACYHAFDELGGVAAHVDAMVDALEANDPRAIGAALANDLEPAACSLKPELRRVLAWIRARKGVLGALLSGSGSACFALTDSKAAAARIASAAEREGHWALATSIVSN